MGLFLVKGFLWAAAFPAFQAPDEVAHFSYIQYWIEEGELPRNAYERYRRNGVSDQLEETLDALEFENSQFNPWFTPSFTQGSTLGAHERELRTSNESPKPEAHYVGYNYPPLGHAINLVPYLIARGDIVGQLFGMRLMSVLLSLLTLLLFYKAGEVYFGSRRLALAITILIGFQPMFSHISAVVNNDNMVNLAYAGFFYTSVKILSNTQPMSGKQLIALAFWTVLGILSKTQGIALLLLLAVLFYFKRADYSKQLKKISTIGALIAITVAIALGGRYSDITAIKLPDGNIIQWLGSLILALWQYGNRVFETFWAQFGWLDTRGPASLYFVLKLLALVSVAGIAKIMIKNYRNPDQRMDRYLFGTALVGILFYTAYFVSRFLIKGSYTGGYAEQGRHFFIILFPLFALGLKGLLEWLPKEQHKQQLVHVLECGMILLNVVLLFTLIIPRYYGG